MSALWELMTEIDEWQTGRGWAEALYGRACSRAREKRVRRWLRELARSGMADTDNRGCGIILYRPVG